MSVIKRNQNENVTLLHRPIGYIDVVEDKELAHMNSNEDENRSLSDSSRDR